MQYRNQVVGEAGVQEVREKGKVLQHSSRGSKIGLAGCGMRVKMDKENKVEL